MDKVIEKERGVKMFFSKKAILWWCVVVFVFFAIYLMVKPSRSSVKINSNALVVGMVKRGEFSDYIRVSGVVQPLVTVQLSPIEGGVVDKIFIEEGAVVKRGEAILKLSNDNLDLQILNSEAELAEKENILRNTQIQMEQDRLNVKQTKVEFQLNVKRLKRCYEQQKVLFDNMLIAKEEFLKAQEDYDLAMEKLELILEKEVQDSLFRSTQVERMRESLENMQMNMQMIRKRKEKLTIKAPIDGQLGILDAVLGENISAGTKIGQISDMSSYKIEAQIDEHYIDRVIPGLVATYERQENEYNMSIRKVYPEVRNGKFKADFKFSDVIPQNIRSGQTFYLNLQLGQSEEAIFIPRGSFFQTTGGKWIYVLTPDGKKAEKREIRIGRQNPQYYEVLEGLAEGEQVVISGYDNFGNNDVLILN